MKKILFSVSMASIATTAFAVSENWNTADAGSAPAGADWSIQGAPYDEYTVTAGAGRDSTNGLVQDPSSGVAWKLLNKNGVSGDVITLSSDFQFSINENTPNDPNQNSFGLYVSTTANWWDGTSKFLTFNRRNAGKRWGVTLSDGAGTSLTGWNNNSLLGLSNTLPAAGLTEASDWFTMEFQLTDLGNDSWTTEGTVYNSVGEAAWAVDGTISLPSGSTLYGGYALGWNGDSQAPLERAAVASLTMDNFSIVVPEPSSYALLAGLAALGFIAVRRRK